MTYLVSGTPDTIRVCDWDNTDLYGDFDKATGTKIRGTLDMTPDKVLFLAWRQKQSPKLTEKQLTAMWAGRVK